MSTIDIGDKLPPLKLTANGDKTINLGDYLGKKLVIYFYPKDSTPGCTTEAKDFRDLQQQFSAANTAIIGVSADSVASHDKFIAKHDLNFDLISDSEQTLCKAFGVYKLKKMFNREFMGIERSTFLFDKDGILSQQWRKVRVKNHAQQVLEKAQQL